MRRGRCQSERSRCFLAQIGDCRLNDPQDSIHPAGLRTLDQLISQGASREAYVHDVVVEVGNFEPAFPDIVPDCAWASLWIMTPLESHVSRRARSSIATVLRGPTMPSRWVFGTGAFLDTPSRTDQSKTDTAAIQAGSQPAARQGRAPGREPCAALLPVESSRRGRRQAQ
jgi:hypothetical protein